MSRIPVIFFSLLLSLLVSLPALSYVMGEDNRRLADDEALPAVVGQSGMIRIQGEEFVSGLLTGANCDVIISAGHAAYYWQDNLGRGWQKGALRAQGQFSFSLEPARVNSWQKLSLLASGYQQAGQVGKDEQDWSVFRSASPVLDDCVSPPLLSLAQGCHGRLLMAGFHFDLPASRLLDNSCEVKQSLPNGLLVHDCDSKDGSSGAPLFCADDDRLRLLAINISGLSRRDYYDAGVYGKAGRPYNPRQHKNFAVGISGAFYRALQEALAASSERRQGRPLPAAP